MYKFMNKLVLNTILRKAEGYFFILIRTKIGKNSKSKRENFAYYMHYFYFMSRLIKQEIIISY